MSFRELKVGDKVTRCIGGGYAFMDMIVMAIDGDDLICATEKCKDWPLEEMWRFNRDVGCEEDHELGWGKKFGVTGTYLKKV